MAFQHFYRPGERTGDALACCLDCGDAPTTPGFGPRHEAPRGHSNPCWCWGPWQSVDPADRPDTTLGREHSTGAPGCDYAVQVTDADSCPEWCQHEGKCAEARAAIHAAERFAEDGWLRVAEQGYPGYDFDPNDPRSTDR